MVWSIFNVPSMCFYFCLYFLCFYEYILHRVCVCIILLGKKKKKKITDLPTLFFSSPPTQKKIILPNARQFYFLWRRGWGGVGIEL